MLRTSNIATCQLEQLHSRRLDGVHRLPIIHKYLFLSPLDSLHLLKKPISIQLISGCWGVLSQGFYGHWWYIPQSGRFVALSYYKRVCSLETPEAFCIPVGTWRLRGSPSGPITRDFLVIFLLVSFSLASFLCLFSSRLHVSIINNNTIQFHMVACLSFLTRE